MCIIQYITKDLFLFSRRSLHITQSPRTRVADVPSGDIARKSGQHVTIAGIFWGVLFVSGYRSVTNKRCTGRRRLKNIIVILGQQMGIDKDRAYYGKVNADF